MTLIWYLRICVCIWIKTYICIYPLPTFHNIIILNNPTAKSSHCGFHWFFTPLHDEKNPLFFNLLKSIELLDHWVLLPSWPRGHDKWVEVTTSEWIGHELILISWGGEKDTWCTMVTEARMSLTRSFYCVNWKYAIIRYRIWQVCIDSRSLGSVQL